MQLDRGTFVQSAKGFLSPFHHLNLRFGLRIRWINSTTWLVVTARGFVML